MTATSSSDAIETFLNLHVIQSAALSPTGQHAAFVVLSHDRSTDRDFRHLWLYTRANGIVKQITFGQHNNTQPAWSPDGETFAFVSSRSGKNQVYSLSIKGGEARPLTDFEQGVHGNCVWSPDGTQIAFTAGAPIEKKPNFSQPYRVTRHVYRYDAIGYLDGAIQNVYTIDVVTGALQQFTDGQTRHSILGWSPSGDRLLLAELMAPDSHYADLKRLKIVEYFGGKTTPILAEWGKIKGAAWHPNGTHIVFMGWPQGAKRGTKADLYVVDLAEETEPDNRTPDLSCGVGGILLDGMPTALLLACDNIFVLQDGQSALVHVQLGGTVQVAKIALSGEPSVQPLITGDRTAYLMGIDQAEKTLLFAATDINQPYDLYLADANGRSERRITDVNAIVLNMPWARVEHLQFTSKYEVEVEGWLIMPSAGEGPFPTILEIHGGPHCGYGHAYHVLVQLLVSQGYAVLMINHRGSTGYGTPFGTALLGDWGNLDYADLMAGVDTAIETGFVDGDRLGVCGISGGGYLSTWIITHTGRFKAAVPENPITNWHSFYGTSDIGVRFGLGQMGGHPHEIPDIYFRCSPINYAHRCTTPTLLIQGEVDYRCPAEQSEQFYTALKANGCEVEMLRLPNSPHGGSVYGPPATKRAKLEALLDWMNRFVMEG